MAKKEDGYAVKAVKEHHTIAKAIIRQRRMLLEIAKILDNAKLPSDAYYHTSLDHSSYRPNCYFNIHLSKVTRDWIDENLFLPLRRAFNMSWKMETSEFNGTINYTATFANIIGEIQLFIMHSSPDCKINPIIEIVPQHTVTRYSFECSGNDL
jgi:hypothetical protein